MKLKRQETSTPKDSFSNEQVKGKVLKRVRKTLPLLPEQGVSVLKTLLAEIAQVEAPKPPSSRSLSDSVLSSIKNFYLNNEISRDSPSTKDFVTVKKNGQRDKMSVKHLLFPIEEVYGMFCQENPDIKISISKFYKLRPVNVLSFSKMPQNVCCCQIHENVRGALKGLKKTNAMFDHLYVDNEMHKNFVCDSFTDECFHNTCENCKEGIRFNQLIEQVEETFAVVIWSKWVKVDKKLKSDVSEDQSKNSYCNIEKVKKTGTITELFEELSSLIPEYLNHQFIKMKQSKASSLMIEIASKEDSKVAVILCDFAEKFKCSQQNATQSAHYGQQPVIIFTVGIYHRGFTPLVVVSENEKQTKEAILSYLDVVLETLPPTVELVEFWSDNGTSQFKNQYVMQAVKSFESRRNLKICWNFFAPMHGKSIVDGIGGTVKRFVHDRIIAQDLLIKSASDFAGVAKSSKIKIILMKNDDIDRRNIAISFSKIIKDSKPIPDMKKNHRFQVKAVKIGKKMQSKIVGSVISEI